MNLLKPSDGATLSSNEPIILSSTLGMTGLINLGNSCFMNSILQCLNQTIDLKNYLLGKHYDTKLDSTIKKKLNNIKRIPLDNEITSVKEKYIVYQLIKLYNTLWKGIPLVKPSSFLDLFFEKYTSFSRGGQADAHETIKCILDD